MNSADAFLHALKTAVVHLCSISIALGFAAPGLFWLRAAPTLVLGCVLMFVVFFGAALGRNLNRKIQSSFAVSGLAVLTFLVFAVDELWIKGMLS
jgi:hypothetical protein